MDVSDLVRGLGSSCHICSAVLWLWQCIISELTLHKKCRNKKEYKFYTKTTKDVGLA